MTYPAEFEAAAHRLGLKLQRVDVTTTAELDVPSRPCGERDRWGPLSSTMPARRARAAIADLAKRYRLPTVSGTQEFAQAGGCSDMVRPPRDVPPSRGLRRSRAQGARPGDLPIEQPDKFLFVLNRKTARALGITLSQNVLARADQVIE